jgi:hypothetical protein
MVTHWSKLRVNELHIEITQRSIHTFHCCRMFSVILDRWEGTRVPHKHVIVIGPRGQELLTWRPFQATNLWTRANHLVIKSHYQSWNLCTDFKIYFWAQILCSWTLSIVLSLSKNTVLFIFQNSVSDTGFCLRLQVKPPVIGTISIDWAELSRFYLKTETECSLRNVAFCNINRTVFFK